MLVAGVPDCTLHALVCQAARQDEKPAHIIGRCRLSALHTSTPCLQCPALSAVEARAAVARISGDRKLPGHAPHAQATENVVDVCGGKNV